MEAFVRENIFDRPKEFWNTEKLRDAYLFLRDTEHKLQVAAGLQTHALPDSSSGFAMLSARLGFGKSTDAPTRFTCFSASARKSFG